MDGAADDRVITLDIDRSLVVRDCDSIYGDVFQQRVERLGIEPVVIAARSPWQNAYVERFIGSLRRECLDHVIALDECQLLRVVRRYVA